MARVDAPGYTKPRNELEPAGTNCNQLGQVIELAKTSTKEFWQLVGVVIVTVADQRVTNNNVIQRIVMSIAIIKYLQIKTLNEFIKLN